jgi:ribonuclease III
MLPIEKLIPVIKYDFKDINLLELAMTHKSKGKRNNERLEFIGDSVLNMTVAIDLFTRFEKASEGQMSRLRAQLVNRETLADIAREFKLGDFLRLGSGELKSGGYRRDSILSDSVEAIIGAIVLDSDIHTAQGKVLDWYQSRLNKVNLDKPMKDAKTLLQEYLQGKAQALPVYDVVKITGDPHDQEFTVETTVTGADTVSAKAPSRKIAEQICARQILSTFGIAVPERSE